MSAFAPAFPQTRVSPSTSVKTSIGLGSTDDATGPSGGKCCYALGKNTTWMYWCPDSVKSVPEHWRTAMRRVKIESKGASTASRQHSIEEHTGTPKPILDREPESVTEHSFYREKGGRRHGAPRHHNTLKFPYDDVSELGDAESSRVDHDLVDCQSNG
ncbi:hypothetical protein ARMSODRAFT_982857 [Armillaria solidipes]|uniref:Uncharacterized protein n=1 Tax=Armillaria solidipes TaxID=1076256 RepID=A0A2H3APT3_9AGAR|nr:hypothetical protein ARMSODRAFT_982857 [Armillaria solidipes]